MRVLFLTNIPSPYRVDFFNELGKNCDLTVIFEKETSDERDESWVLRNCDNFREIILKGISAAPDKSFCPGIIRHLKPEKYDAVIVGNSMTPTGMLAVRYLKLRKIKFWIEGDGAFPKSGKGIKEYIKKSIIKCADGYLSTAKLHDEYYLKYGAEKSKIHRYPFSSVRQANILESALSLDEKNVLREKVGIKADMLVISVGRFNYQKGFDTLIKSGPYLDKKICVVIIGGKPTSEYSDLLNNLNLTNYIFIDFMQPEKLAEYYKAADLFVLPTRKDIWGLVVNEAMAFGLPVVTTTRCIAGTELVKDGYNGYLVPPDDEKALAEKIMEILSDTEKCVSMAKNSLKIIRKYTVENMATVHYKLLKEKWSCEE